MHRLNRLFVFSALILSMIFTAASQHAFAGVTDSYNGYASDDSVDGDTAVNSNELLVFDVNRNITTADRGFPKDDPPRSAANGNWRSPINYAEGTLYFRVQVRNQPRPQNMRLQFCVWQDRFYLENCARMENVYGSSGTVVTWSQSVQDMWRLGGRSIDWSRARQRYGIAIKNAQGLPVSNFNGWNWNGENPNHWYPLDARITVVVVEKGGTFSGWQNYVGGGGGGSNPTPTSQPTNTPRPAATATNTPRPSAPTATNTPPPAATATNTPPPAATATNTPVPTAPAATATPVPSTGGCAPTIGNLVKNGSFENNLADWRFWNPQVGSINISSSAYDCAKGSQIQLSQANSNIQLYQSGIALRSNTRYRVSFAAYSSRGQDVGLYVHKHGSPYTNYGLQISQVNLQSGWQQYTTEFTTHSFSGTVNDARLRFWFSPFARAGDTYWIDNISIVEVGAVTAANAALHPTDLLGMDETDFDASILDLSNNGDVVEESAEQERVFLPLVAN